MKLTLDDIYKPWKVTFVNDNGNGNKEKEEQHEDSKQQCKSREQ